VIKEYDKRVSETATVKSYRTSDKDVGSFKSETIRYDNFTGSRSNKVQDVSFKLYLFILLKTVLCLLLQVLNVPFSRYAETADA